MLHALKQVLEGFCFGQIQAAIMSLSKQYAQTYLSESRAKLPPIGVDVELSF